MAKMVKLFNSNVYLDDVNHLGKANEVEVPKITEKTTEHQTLGMIGPVELFAGVEKLEMKIKLSGYHKDLLDQMSPTSANKITVRAAQHEYADSSVSGTQQVRFTCIGRRKELAPSALKAGEGDAEISFALDYAKLVVDDEEIYEIDIPNYIYRVKGKDILADVRNALGI